METRARPDADASVLDHDDLVVLTRPAAARQRILPALPLAVLDLLPIVFAAVAALAVALLIFPHLSHNHDEPVYLLQAETLRAGRLTVPAPAGDAMTFRPWLTAVRGDSYVFKYTPVHASLLLAGRAVFGTYVAALPMIAAGLTGAVLFLAHEVLQRRRAARVATWAFALSPLALVINGTYLSYSSSLLLLTLFAGTLLRGLRTGHRGWLAAAGLAGGLAVFARPFDAVLFAVPLGLYALVAAWRSRRLVPTVVAIAAGAIVPLLLIAVFNHVVTGAFWRFPFSLLDPADTIGFGRRRLAPRDRYIRYGLEQAWTSFGHQARWLQAFAFGGPILLALAAAHAVGRRAAGAQRALALVAITVPIGYLTFWGPYNLAVVWGVSEIFGPTYWMPVLVPIAILGAAAIARIRAARQRVAAVLLGVLVLANVGATGRAMAANLAFTHSDADLYRPLHELEPGRRLVVIPRFRGGWLLHPLAKLRNSVDHDGDSLYALSGGNADVALAARYPDRRLYQYRVYGRLGGGEPNDARAQIVPSAVLQGPVLHADVVIRNQTGRRFVAVQVVVGASAHRLVLDEFSTLGKTYRLKVPITGLGALPVDGREWQRFHFPQKNYPAVVSAFFSDEPTFANRSVVEHRFWHVPSADGIQLITPGEVFRASSITRRFRLTERDPRLDVRISIPMPVAD